MIIDRIKNVREIGPTWLAMKFRTHTLQLVQQPAKPADEYYERIL